MKWGLSLAAITVVSLCCCNLADGSILVSAALDKTQYHPGEALDYQITADNPTAEPITLHFISGAQVRYVLDGGPPQSNGQTQAITQRTIPAHSSYTWIVPNDWRYINLRIGPHEFIGGVIGYGDAAPVLFDVITPVFPTDDFMIDFDMLPDSAVVPQTVTEFWQFGVRFRSQATSSYHRPGIGGTGGNRFLGTNSSTNPPGYNIIADFDIPVYAIAADVSGAIGRQISMIARDANGNVLDTVVSSAIPTTGEFLPLSVQSISPIASVEWWSNPNNVISVDNLAITMPEPGVSALMTLMSLLLIRRPVRSPCH